MAQDARLKLHFITNKNKISISSKFADERHLAISTNHNITVVKQQNAYYIHYKHVLNMLDTSFYDIRKS